MPGFSIAERIEVIAPHPLARLSFTGCRVPKTRLLGARGQGFKVAMQTLDIFRTSVAAAALGFARRALDEAIGRATGRRMFNQSLADFQITQAKLAQMATAVDSAALLTYRAAWQRDQGGSVTREAARPNCGIWPKNRLLVFRPSLKTIASYSGHIKNENIYGGRRPVLPLGGHWLS